MSHDEWPNGNNEKEYDPILGASEYITWFDEDVVDPTWHQGCEALLKSLREQNRGRYIEWSYTPTRTDGLSDDTVEGSRTA